LLAALRGQAFHHQVAPSISSDEEELDQKEAEGGIKF